MEDTRRIYYRCPDCKKEHWMIPIKGVSKQEVSHTCGGSIGRDGYEAYCSGFIQVSLYGIDSSSLQRDDKQ